MRSTGEVMGHAASFGHAFAKSQLGAGTALPLSGGVLMTVNDFDKGSALKIARDLRAWASPSMPPRHRRLLANAGLPVTVLEKGSSAQPGYSTFDALRDGKIQLIINTPLGANAREDGMRIRQLATRMEIPLITTLSAAQAAVAGIRAMRQQELSVRSLQEHYAAGK
jgi:carbamoyl-phosphate synthase large subunit